MGGWQLTYAPVNELYIRSNGIDTPFTREKAPGLCWLSWSRGGQRLYVHVPSFCLPMHPLAIPRAQILPRAAFFLKTGPDIHVTCGSPDITLSRTHKDNECPDCNKARLRRRLPRFSYSPGSEGEQKLNPRCSGSGRSSGCHKQSIREGVNLSVEWFLGQAVGQSCLSTGADAWRTADCTAQTV